MRSKSGLGDLNEAAAHHLPTAASRARPAVARAQRINAPAQPEKRRALASSSIRGPQHQVGLRLLPGRYVGPDASLSSFDSAPAIVVPRLVKVGDVIVRHAQPTRFVHRRTQDERT
jgi:hypothetical protein